MKNNTIYVCSKCDAQFPKWSGRCFQCGGWATLNEQVSEKVSKKILDRAQRGDTPAGTVMTFDELSADSLQRLFSDLQPAATLYPKGLPLGSVTLLAGEPGAGKSTLALQIALNFSEQAKVLYVSAEESGSQVKEKIDRLGAPKGQFYFASDKTVEVIASTLTKHQVQVAVIDSIQTVSSNEVEAELGSINQLKAVTVKLLAAAKENNVAVIIIGHVTKEGVVAGPKSLEHLVDIVLYLEGEADSRFRLLRASKNRYGSAGKVSVLQMTNQGLTVVKQPATALISNFQAKPGSVITAVVDSGQVLFLELQSLVNKSSFGYAKRTASGFPVKRLEVLLAVMKKRLGISLDQYDVYLNVVGGFQLKDPALDAAVCLSIISSLKNTVLNESTVIFGEVGLAGELRVAKDTALRIETAVKHNFTKIIIPPIGKVQIPSKVKIISADSLTDILQHLGWS